MNKFITIAAFVCSSLGALAQTPKLPRAEVLSNIEKNNTSLATLRKKVDVEKATNALTKILPDPEFGFSYSWGNHPGMGRKKTFSASQQLDWATISGIRAKAVKSQNEMVLLEYLNNRQDILAEADLLLVQLIYQNAKVEEMDVRKERANLLKQLFEKKFEQGDANQIELNKVRLYHTSTMAEWQRSKTEQKAIADEIRRINGNKTCDYTLARYEATELPDLKALVTQAKLSSPEVLLADASLKAAKDQMRLSKVEAVPSFNIGYTGEHVAGNNFNGISVGFNVPVWGKAHRQVKIQKEDVLASEMNVEDIALQTEIRVEKQYLQVNQLLQIAEQFKKEIAQSNEDTRILRRALDEGQLSLIDYLTEIKFYDDIRIQALDAERDSQLALSTLISYFR